MIFFCRAPGGQYIMTHYIWGPYLQIFKTVKSLLEFWFYVVLVSSSKKTTTKSLVSVPAVCTNQNTPSQLHIVPNTHTSFSSNLQNCKEFIWVLILSCSGVIFKDQHHLKFQIHPLIYQNTQSQMHNTLFQTPFSNTKYILSNTNTPSQLPNHSLKCTMHFAKYQIHSLHH